MLPTKATIFILGSGGFAHELHDYMHDLWRQANQGRFGSSKFLGSEIFFVDGSNPDALTVEEYHKRLGQSECYSIMGAGHCDIKMRMIEEIKGDIISFVHPRAVNLGKIEEGCILAPGAVVAPRAALGKHVLCNYNSTVGHDSEIGSYSIICPNASVGGTCTLGKGVYVGSNACIRENISIGDGATIGMGAVVTRDVPAGATIINVNERLK